MNGILTNWETTLAGIGMIGVAICGVIVATFDGNPETVVNWNVAIAEVLAGVAFIRTRDLKVSSERSGAK